MEVSTGKTKNYARISGTPREMDFVSHRRRKAQIFVTCNNRGNARRFYEGLQKKNRHLQEINYREYVNSRGT